MQGVCVISSFDDLRSTDIRLLEEASQHGPVTAVMLSDAALKAGGKQTKFTQGERQYFLESLKFVSSIVVQKSPAFEREVLGLKSGQTATLFDRERNDSTRLRLFCTTHGLQLQVVSEAALGNFPPTPMCPVNPRSTGKKVIVTGSFDWFHTGHIRFFEEASELGDLFVVVGHDANIRLLKGDDHPMFNSTERCYIANSIRFAKVAVVSSGHGWLDAEPEIQKIKPDMYVVNDDGDRQEKKQYCKAHGIEYRVLRRSPKPGLPKRASTALRGF